MIVLKKSIDILVDKLNKDTLNKKEIFNFLSFYFYQLKKCKIKTQSQEKYINKIENILKLFKEEGLYSAFEPAKVLVNEIIENIKMDSLPNLKFEKLHLTIRAILLVLGLVFIIYSIYLLGSSFTVLLLGISSSNKILITLLSFFIAGLILLKICGCIHFVWTIMSWAIKINFHIAEKDNIDDENNVLNNKELNSVNSLPSDDNNINKLNNATKTEEITDEVIEKVKKENNRKLDLCNPMSLAYKDFICNLKHITKSKIEDFLLYYYYGLKNNFNEYVKKYKNTEDIKNKIEIYFQLKENVKNLKLRGLIIDIDQNIKAGLLSTVTIYKSELKRLALIGIVMYVLLLAISMSIVFSDKFSHPVLVSAVVLVILFFIMNKLIGYDMYDGNSFIKYFASKNKKELISYINSLKFTDDEIQTFKDVYTGFESEEEIEYSKDDLAIQPYDDIDIAKYESALQTYEDRVANAKNFIRMCIASMRTTGEIEDNKNLYKLLTLSMDEHLTPLAKYKQMQAILIKNTLENFYTYEKFQEDTDKYGIEFVTGVTHFAIKLEFYVRSKSNDRLRNLYYKEDYYNLTKSANLIIKNYNSKKMFINNLPDVAYVYRGVGYANLGKHEQAFEDFEIALNNNTIEKELVYFERGKVYLNQKEYDRALSDFNNAIINAYSDNGDNYYYRALTYIELGETNKALADLILVKDIISDDEYKEKIEAVIAKITDKSYNSPDISNNIEPVKEVITEPIIDSKINLQTCTKEELITLDGFTEDKANKFINERNNGQMWYDIDTFIQEFEIQPHEMILIQDRIKFPEKPKNKYGRRIDI